MRSESAPLLTRQHLRRSGSSGSGLDKHATGPTSTMLARLLVLSACIAAVMICGSLFMPSKVPRTSMRMRGLYESLDSAVIRKMRPSTLVIYVYSKTDPEYERNLQFFVQHGMWEGDGCDYAIIVQQDDKLFGPAKLPELPPNARYILHENRCYDWGTIGWALESGKVDASLYRYIIFMNSSVRGPFLPNYFPRGLHWSKVFTGRLSEEVKLVGSTISCETAYMGGKPGNEARHNAHVQSYVMATDQVGLKVLQEDGRVLACYEEMSDVIFHAELGASAAILDQGYTIDSLMLRYQGTDWRNQSNWDCNAGLNPYAEYAYDGLLLNPLEVLFVKLKAFQVQTDWMSAMMASTYDRWLSQEGGREVNSNVYKDRKPSYRLSKTIAMLIRGRACFDFDLYRSKSADLAALPDDDALWNHFVKDGQFEGRVFRFTCANPLRDNSIAETLMGEAKAVVAQLMSKAFPSGLPQAAFS